VAKGYNASGDVLVALADGTDPNKIWADLQKVTAEWNAARESLQGLLTFGITTPVEHVLQAFDSGEFEESTEYGEPVGLRPTVEELPLGFKFKWYDLAARYTWRYLVDATSAQVDSVANGALTSDSRLVFKGVMGALFNNSRRVNVEGNTVHPLYAGAAGDLPPDHDGESFTDSHNHYVTSGAAVLDQADVDALMELVLEHGYGADPASGRLLLFVNRREGDVVRGFRTVAAGGVGKFDFIASESAPAYLTTETIVGDKPPTSIGSVPLIGGYGPAWIAENSLIPKGYVLAVVSGGDNNQYNPVGFREHVQPANRGFRLVKGRTPAYPIIDSFYVRGFGTGVRLRGAAAVLQVTASPTYTPPAQFVGAA